MNASALSNSILKFALHRSSHSTSNKNVCFLGTFSFLGETPEDALSYWTSGTDASPPAKRIADAIWRHVDRSALFAISFVGSDPRLWEIVNRVRGCFVRGGLVARETTRRRRETKRRLEARRVASTSRCCGRSPQPTISVAPLSLPTSLHDSSCIGRHARRPTAWEIAPSAP